MKNFNELVDLNNLNKNINNEEMNFLKIITMIILLKT